MSYQTAYTQYIPGPVIGSLANSENWNATSKIAQNVIQYGAPVQRTPNIGVGQGASAMTAAGEYLGVARATHHASQVEANATFSCIDEGVVNVLADAAIAEGAALNFNITSGRWTTAATSGTVVAIPGAEADTAASGAGVTFQARLRRIPS